MDEAILEQFDRAEDDLHAALLLGESIIFGYIEVDLVDWLEIYYILRKWQIKMGKRCIYSLQTLVEKYETALEDVDAEFLDSYMRDRKTMDVVDIIAEISPMLGLPGICFINPDNFPQE